MDLQLVTILLTALIGAAFGAWVASMVASSIPNSRLKSFESAIAAGHILLMVDVPSGRVDEIRQLIAAHHPEAMSSGTEPTIPAFP
jgi:alpha/beta superfamily hydrolase